MSESLTPIDVLLERRMFLLVTWGRILDHPERFRPEHSALFFDAMCAQVQRDEAQLRELANDLHKRAEAMLGCVDAILARVTLERRLPTVAESETLGRLKLEIPALTGKCAAILKALSPDARPRLEFTSPDRGARQ